MYILSATILYLMTQTMITLMSQYKTNDLLLQSPRFYKVLRIFLRLNKASHFLIVVVSRQFVFEMGGQNISDFKIISIIINPFSKSKGWESVCLLVSLFDCSLFLPKRLNLSS